VGEAGDMREKRYWFGREAVQLGCVWKPTSRLEHQSAAETLDACADLSKGMVTEITVPDALDSISS
jgi:hypothetical protein